MRKSIACFVLTVTGALAVACDAPPPEATAESAANSATSTQKPTSRPGAAGTMNKRPGPQKQNLPPAPPDVAAPPSDATTTASGLAYKILTKGTGTEKPGPTDQVTVHYSGWQTDGTGFDSSVARGAPATFGVNGVIRGWTEGLQLMTVGDKARFWIPANLAYGDNPGGGRPGGMLVFDVELISIKKSAPAATASGSAAPSANAPPVPEDVAAPPATAKKTPSGLAYRVLQPGKGKTHPKASSQVEVHYSGWTTDGKMFDSSVVRGETITFGLDQVIKGWTEGVQLMVEGEKTRFWIPAELAYGTNPRGGRPAGMLVFDIELIKIK